MTGMPEAGLARELGMSYGAVCIVANLAAGMTEDEITLDEIQQVLATAASDLRRLLESFFELNA